MPQACRSVMRRACSFTQVAATSFSLLKAWAHVACIARSFERSVLDKGRKALLEHQRKLEAQQQEADAQRESLSEASAKLASARDVVRRVSLYVCNSFPCDNSRSMWCTRDRIPLCASFPPPFP